jgi:hypothetical protein
LEQAPAEAAVREALAGGPKGVRELRDYLEARGHGDADLEEITGRLHARGVTEPHGDRIRLAGAAPGPGTPAPPPAPA